MLVSLHICLSLRFVIVLLLFSLFCFDNGFRIILCSFFVSFLFLLLLFSYSFWSFGGGGIRVLINFGYSNSVTW